VPEKSLKSKVFIDEEIYFFPVPSTSPLSSELPAAGREVSLNKLAVFMANSKLTSFGPVFDGSAKKLNFVIVGPVPVIPSLMILTHEILCHYTNDELTLLGSQ
jgi:hypothetical protein